MPTPAQQRMRRMQAERDAKIRARGPANRSGFLDAADVITGIIAAQDPRGLTHATREMVDSLKQAKNVLLDPNTSHAQKRTAVGSMAQLGIYPWGAKFPPKSFPVGPPGSGLTAHRLPVSPDVPLGKDVEDTMTWRGNLIRTGFYQGIPRGMPRDMGSRARYASMAHPLEPNPRNTRAIAREEQGMPVSYNIVRDKDGKLVGSTHMRLFPDATEVDEIFLKENLRPGKKSGGTGDIRILKDMVGPAIDRGLPIRAVPGNPKVGRLLDRLARSHHKKQGRPPVHHDYDPAGRANVDYTAASARARRNVGPPAAPQVPMRQPTAAEVERIAGRMTDPNLGRVIRETHPATTPRNPSPLRDAIAAAAEQRLAQQRALARAQMLAAQRRAPNPIRQSRPGRGGV